MVRNELASHFKRPKEKVERAIADAGFASDKQEFNSQELSDVGYVLEILEKENPTQSLPANTNDNGNGHTNDISDTLLAPTDDDILNLAETTGVELNAIMQAAEQVETLGQLVLWVEEYKRQQSERQIRESVRRRLDLEELASQKQQLSDRLVAAINKKAPDTDQIAKTLGLELPPEVNNLAQPDSDWQKDFLSMARQAVGKN